jgi:NAD(P)-dependent dehydrogenase (short-subunit alcohol dehydrogenase family)
VKARTVFPILLLLLYACGGFCQSAPQTQKTQIELTGVVLTSGIYAQFGDFQQITVCQSPRTSQSQNGTTVALGRISNHTRLTRFSLGRLAKPEEIAKAAGFLAVDGDYITGQELTVNGGFSM